MLQSIQFGFPQTVEITVGIDCQRLVVGQMEDDVRRLGRFQILALAAVCGDKLNPFDIVGILHGMIHAANIDGDSVFVHGDRGQVLFTACFDSIGEKFVHLHAAAGRNDAGVMNGFDDETAVGAAIELGIIHILFPPFWKLFFVSDGCILSKR